MNRQFFLNALDISRDIDFAFDGGRQTQSQSKIQKEKKCHDNTIKNDANFATCCLTFFLISIIYSDLLESWSWYTGIFLFFFYLKI
jgi:hypothetical protein